MYHQVPSAIVYRLPPPVCADLDFTFRLSSALRLGRRKRLLARQVSCIRTAEEACVLLDWWSNQEDLSRRGLRKSASRALNSRSIAWRVGRHLAGGNRSFIHPSVP